MRKEHKFESPSEENSHGGGSRTLLAQIYIYYLPVIKPQSEIYTSEARLCEP